jgi:hypothetical protein
MSKDLTYEECIEFLIMMLKSYSGNKNAQATYLQTFIQQFGPIPNQYADEIKKILEE